MSFKLQMSPRDKASARFIAAVQKAIVEIALAEKEKTKITQQEIAKRLGVNRSVINRMLKGEANLTLRSVAEFAWALGYTPSFELCKNSRKHSSNHFNCSDDDLRIKEVILTRPDRDRGKIDIRAEAKAAVELDEYA